MVKVRQAARGRINKHMINIDFVAKKLGGRECERDYVNIDNTIHHALKHLTTGQLADILERLSRSKRHSSVNDEARRALEHLGAIRQGAFSKLRGVSRVGAEFIEGNRKALQELCSQGIIFGVRYNKKQGRWLRVGPNQLKKATHFMLPMRRPDQEGFYQMHGRAIFVERGGKTYFLKGVGGGKTPADEDPYKQPYLGHPEGYPKGMGLRGGVQAPFARQNIIISKKLRAAYKRLKKPGHKLSENVKLAESWGATSYGFMGNIVLFKVKQVPISGRNLEERVLKKKPREKRAAKFAEKRGDIAKTEGTSKAYKIPPTAAGEMVIMSYSVKTPFRIKNIATVGIEQILHLYGMTGTGEKIYFKGRKITELEAAEIAIKGFAARLALNCLTLKEANVLSGSPGLSIFSRHNTTIAGENLDLDSAEIIRDNQEHQRSEEFDKPMIFSQLYYFVRQVENELGLSAKQRGRFISEAEKLFLEIIREK